MKKFLALLLSALMVMTMIPFQVFASPVCDHLLTVTNWSSLPAAFKTAHPEMEPADSEHPVASFISVKVPGETCETDGWKIDHTDDSGFCILCGKFYENGAEVEKGSATSATIKKLKGKKKYYVRVRTYKVVAGKKVYSSWSKVKTVTTK